MTTQKSADRPQGAAATNGNGRSARTAASGVANRVSGAAGTVAGAAGAAAGTVAAHLPEAAAQTRAVVDEATRRMETGSDEMLTAGATLSLGMAVGMLIGGAPRLLVILALIPAAAMGLTLLDRGSRGAAARSRRPTS